MQRGHGVLIEGGIVIFASISIILLSNYSLASLAESMPTSLPKNIIKSALNVNQTALEESQTHRQD